MDKNVVLEVSLFSIVVDASNAKFRKVAAAPQENKSIQPNKPDPKPIDSTTQQENDQVQNNPSQLAPKADLVSSLPQKQTTDNRIHLNFTYLSGLPPVQNQVMNDEESLKDLKYTDGGKNSSSADLTMSNPDRGEVPKHVNGTDLLNPSPLNEKDSGKSGGKEMDNGKTPKYVNGTDLLSPLVNKTDNGKSGGNETDNGKNDRVEGNTIDDKSSSSVKETDNGKDAGTEESIDDKSSSEFGVHETCDGLPKCTDLSPLIACIQNFDTDNS